MTEHTPGPWEARKGAGWYVARPRYGEATLAVGMGDVTLVTSPSETPWNYDAESEANARLIAAAPELLEALETLLGNWPQPLGPDRMDYTVRPVGYDKAIAAIAKARGE